MVKWTSDTGFSQAGRHSQESTCLPLAINKLKMWHFRVSGHSFKETDFKNFFLTNLVVSKE